MSQKRITKKWLQNHMTYSWWKYMVLAAICVLGVNLVFTMTAYRVPEEKKVEVFVLNGYVDSVALHEELWPEFVKAYPEQEELIVMNINLAGGDMYAPMQFSTYTAAQQGDVCLLTMSEFKKMTAAGADEFFMDLTPYIESGVIRTEGLDLTVGTLKTAEGDDGVYAIPADGLFGLFKLGNDPTGSVLCILNYSGNEECSAAVLNLMLERYTQEKPEGYDAQKAAKQGLSTMY